MKLLAIETATCRQSVAIVHEGRVLASAAHDEPGSHSRWLVPTIDRVLGLSGCRLEDCDAFALSVGPGSFTGLRVGLATLLGFRAVTGKPIVTVPTLEAMAWGCQGSRGPICPILPCRKGEVYWAQYEWSPDGHLKRLVDAHVGPPQAVAASVTRPTFALGDGWLTSQEWIAPDLLVRTRDWREVPAGQMHPSATVVAQAGLERLRAGRVAGEIVVPQYVQRAEAELTQGRIEGKSARILRGAGRAPRRSRPIG